MRLPAGAVFSGANLKQAHFLNAFTTSTSGVWSFVLGLGEPPFSVRYTATKWAGADTTGVTVCPNAQGPADGRLSRPDGARESEPDADPTSVLAVRGELVRHSFATLAGNGTAGYSSTQVKNRATWSAPPKTSLLRRHRE